MLNWIAIPVVRIYMWLTVAYSHLWYIRIRCFHSSTMHLAGKWIPLVANKKYQQGYFKASQLNIVIRGKCVCLSVDWLNVHAYYNSNINEKSYKLTLSEYVHLEVPHFYLFYHYLDNVRYCNIVLQLALQCLFNPWMFWLYKFV
jgi:hypothetical protein